MKRTGMAWVGLWLAAAVSVSRAQEWQEVFPSNPPPARVGHSLTALADGRVILFGGLERDGTPLNDTHEYGNGEWQEYIIVTTRPPARRSHAAWGVGNKLYVQGGYGEGGEFLSDLWEFDPDPPPAVENWRFIHSVTGKGARASHAAVPLPNGDVLFFGGQTADGRQQDAWVAYRGTGEWTQAASMPSNWSGGCAHFIGTGHVWAVGTSGQRAYGYSVGEDAWTWESNAPPMNGSASSVVVPAEDGREKIVIYGGYDTNYNPNAEVYEYHPPWPGQTVRVFSTRVEDMADPVIMPASAPLPRTTTTVDVVVFGGSDDHHDYQNRTWRYSVPAAPRPAQLQKAEGAETPAFDFYGEPGYVYEVQSTRSLKNPVWTRQVAYTGAAQQVRYVMPLGTLDVYRVVGNRPD